MSAEYDHDELFGPLRRDDERRIFEATMEMSPGHKARVTIDWMGMAPDEALEKARQIYAIVIEREPEYKRAIAESLLELYNGNWREGEAIDEEEFVRRITISSMNIAPIEFGEDGCVSFYYLDGGLFAGHYIEVLLSDGFEFLNAQLAG